MKPFHLNYNIILEFIIGLTVKELCINYDFIELIIKTNFKSKTTISINYKLSDHETTFKIIFMVPFHINLCKSNRSTAKLPRHLSKNLFGRQCNSRAYLFLKNAMSQMRFNPGTSRIVSYRSTN